MSLYHSGAAPSLKAAWKMVKNNPGYPPAMVPMKHRWSDPTMIKTSLAKKRKKAKKNGKKGLSHAQLLAGFGGKAAQRKAMNNPHPFMQRRGQFSTSQTFGVQPVNRRNPRRKKARRNTLTNMFNPDLRCCISGQPIPIGAQMVVHPTKKGPRGGKKYCLPQYL